MSGSDGDGAAVTAGAEAAAAAARSSAQRRASHEPTCCAWASRSCAAAPVPGHAHARRCGPLPPHPAAPPRAARTACRACRWRSVGSDPTVMRAPRPQASVSSSSSALCATDRLGWASPSFSGDTSARSCPPAAPSALDASAAATASVAGSLRAAARRSNAWSDALPSHGHRSSRRGGTPSAPGGAWDGASSVVVEYGMPPGAEEYSQLSTLTARSLSGCARCAAPPRLPSGAGGEAAERYSLRRLCQLRSSST